MATHRPIQHVVMIVKENHTFDNYFGTFPGAEGMTGLERAPDPPSFDPPHNHEAWLKRAQGAVRQQYTEADIPAYFAYARQFTLCDNFFTDVASQSEPNHLMLITADSPLIDNFHARHPGEHGEPVPPFRLASLPASLKRAGHTWRSYEGFYFKHIAGLAGHQWNVTADQFDADVERGDLATVSWLYAPEGFSEHPPHGRAAGTPVISPGMQWTVNRINHIGQSPLWASTVIFLTWDDWGGWYDHIEPQGIEQWKDDGTDYAGTQFRYGPRVPCLVLSPYAKQGYISKVFHSHVSLVKFCEKTFGLDPLTGRDTAADAMSDCFDFGQQPAAPPSWSPSP